METQWSVGVGGAMGLNYPVLFELIDRKGFSGDEWWRVFEDVRHMEQEALKEIRKK